MLNWLAEVYGLGVQLHPARWLHTSPKGCKRSFCYVSVFPTAFNCAGCMLDHTLFLIWRVRWSVRDTCLVYRTVLNDFCHVEDSQRAHDLVKTETHSTGCKIAPKNNITDRKVRTAHSRLHLSTAPLVARI